VGGQEGDEGIERGDLCLSFLCTIIKAPMTMAMTSAVVYAVHNDETMFACVCAKCLAEKKVKN